MFAIFFFSITHNCPFVSVCFILSKIVLPFGLSLVLLSFGSLKENDRICAETVYLQLFLGLVARGNMFR